MGELELLKERYQLVTSRILLIPTEETVQKPYREYFIKTAAFFKQIIDLMSDLEQERLNRLSFEQCQSYNQDLYKDIIGSAYETSYANPSYAVSCLGKEYGQLLSFAYVEFRAAIACAYENKLEQVTIACELFVSLYNIFEGHEPNPEEVRDILYWYVSDYCDVFYAEGIQETFDPHVLFAKNIVQKSNFSDKRYLFSYGEYISDQEICMAEFMNGLSDEEIKEMADTFVQGYVRGFTVTNKDLSKKKNVGIEYTIGMERMIRQAMVEFEKLGMQVVIRRYGLHSVNKKKSGKRGFSASSPNKQYDYDHLQDEAIYLDKAFVERKLSVLRVTCEKYADMIGIFAGPAVVEDFGEEPFEPKAKTDNLSLSVKQQKLSVDLVSESSRILNSYLHPDETSFTIIAFPTPAIGKDFQEIFKETVKINTLNYETYRQVQEVIIDTFDQAEYVRVLGNGENKTDLTIQLCALKNPEKETKFENCLADVNIPLGEVFTTPVLKGTNGILHVKEVFLRDIKYIDLIITLKDGCVSDYSCKNFNTEEANKALFRENVLQNHETLPLGEFAVGTNTTAYAMAKRFDLINKLPILIIEKMGPHFALGDTCYSHSEEVRMFNPDGKEVVAKENEFSLLRKSDESKAYFNCHTDITIPYDEISELSCYAKDGSKTEIIRNGRFVLAGTEMLNEALERG